MLFPGGRLPSLVHSSLVGGNERNASLVFFQKMSEEPDLVEFLNDQQYAANDDPDGERWSTCPKQSMYAVDVIAVGTMRARCVTTGLPYGLRGTECEDEESRAVCRNMPLVYLATGSMEIWPIFQPGAWESMGVCHL